MRGLRQSFFEHCHGNLLIHTVQASTPPTPASQVIPGWFSASECWSVNAALRSVFDEARFGTLCSWDGTFLRRSRSYFQRSCPFRGWAGTFRVPACPFL